MKYTSSNQEPREFHVQPGEYDLRVIDAVETVSKTSGAEMIKLTLEVEGHGCRLFDYLIASESTAWKIDSFRRALGENVEEEIEVEISARDLIGKTARARLKTEEYNGKLNNKVDAWLESAGATSKPTAPAAEEKDDNEPF